MRNHLQFFKLGFSVLLILLLTVGCGRKSQDDDGAPPGNSREITTLHVTPEALTLTALNEEQPLTLTAYDAQGRTVTLSEADVTWLSSASADVSLKPSSANTVMARAEVALGSSIIFAQLKSKPELNSQPVTVLIADPEPTVTLVPDESIIFPPPNFSDVAQGTPELPGFDLKNETIGGFSVDELTAQTQGASGTIKYATVLRTSTPPQVGDVLMAREGSSLQGEVLFVETRGDYTLIQLQVVELEQLYRSVDFSFSTETLSEQGLDLTLPNPSDTLTTQADSECGVTGSANILSTPNTTRSVGPIWDLTYTRKDGEWEEIYFKFGVEASLYFAPKLRIQPGVRATLKCTYEIGEIPIPLSGPLAAIILPEFGVSAEARLVTQAAAGPSLDIGAVIDGKLALWNGFQWLPDGEGFRALCSSLDECTTREFSSDWILEADVSPTGPAGLALKADATGGFYGVVDSQLQLGGSILEGVSKVCKKIPFVKRFCERTEEFLEIEFISGEVGPELAIDWFTEQWALDRRETDTTGQGELYLKAALFVDPDGAAGFISKLFRDFQDKGSRLTLLQGKYRILSAYKPLGEEAFYVDGKRSRAAVSAAPGDVLELRVDVERSEPVMVVPDLLGNGLLDANGFWPTKGSVWLREGEKVVQLVPQENRKLVGKFTVTEALCAKADEKGELTFDVTGFNKLFNAVEVPTYLLNFTVKCEDTENPETPDDLATTLSGTIGGLPAGNWRVSAYDLKSQRVVGASSQVTDGNFELDVEATRKTLNLSGFTPVDGVTVSPKDVQLGTMTLLAFDDANSDGKLGSGESASLVNDPRNTFPNEADKYVQFWYSPANYTISGQGETTNGTPVIWRVETSQSIEGWLFALTDQGTKVSVTSSPKLQGLSLNVGRSLSLTSSGNLSVEELGNDLVY